VTPREVRERVEELFALWNGESALDRVEEFYAPDYEADYMPYGLPRKGLAGIRAMIENARGPFPDYREDLIDVVCEEDRAAVRLRISFTHTSPWGPVQPTGKLISYEELLMLTFRDGKVVRQRGIADNLSVFRQLGIVGIPPGQFASREDAEAARP
jgi:predicted ester cyclase